VTTYSQKVDPGRSNDVDNLVAACSKCNSIKRHYDASKEKGKEIVITETIPITEELRLRLISIATDEINKRKATNDWEGEFRNAQRLFKKAVEAYREVYRKCKETLVAA
jgi:hypothetical protein